MQVVIIGGGPAGMLAGISAARCGNDVTIVEKMNTCGSKLLITGKGRCNITSNLNMSEFINNIPGNGRFLYSAFNNFTNKDIIELLRKHGVEIKVERGNRIFPVSDKASTVLNALLDELKDLGVKIINNTAVTKILIREAKIQGIEIRNLKTKEVGKIFADKVILATGGKSYSKTGSTGDGYKFAEILGHNITKIKPSLVPMVCEEIELCKSMQGLSLKNIEIKVINLENNKTIYEDFGEMLFTHFGVSGPTILSASSHILRLKQIEKLLRENKIILKIDLKPALTEEKLDNRILKDFELFKNKQFKHSLDNLLPRKMITSVIKLSGINEEKKVNEINKGERRRLLKLLKEFKLTIKDFRDIEEAIITAGGVDIRQINSSTMESKIIKGLYFAGEIIDVDAYTGGFNLQIAYSTGYTAGMNHS